MQRCQWKIGEVEYYALASLAAECLFCRYVMSFLGLELVVELGTDSTAAMGVAARSGVGRLRGLETKVLWLQQKVKDKELRVFKVRGDYNTADLGTKILAMNRLHQLCRDAGLVRYSDGRVESISE